MSNSSKKLPKRRSVVHPDTFQTLERLLEIKRQWNGPGEGTLTVESALKELNRIASNYQYPEALRRNAAMLQKEIVQYNQAPKRKARAVNKKKESR